MTTENVTKEISPEENTGIVLPIGALTKSEVAELKKLIPSKPNVLTVALLPSENRKLFEEVSKVVSDKILDYLWDYCIKNIEVYREEDIFKFIVPNKDFKPKIKLDYIKKLVLKNDNAKSILENWKNLSTTITLLNTRFCNDKGQRRIFYHAGLLTVNLPTMSQNMIKTLSETYADLVKLYPEIIFNFIKDDFRTFYSGFELPYVRGNSLEELEEIWKSIGHDEINRDFLTKHGPHVEDYLELLEKYKDSKIDNGLIQLAIRKYYKEILLRHTARELSEIYTRFQHDPENFNIFRDFRMEFLVSKTVELSGYEEFFGGDDISGFLNIVRKFSAYSGPRLELWRYLRDYKPFEGPVPEELK